MFTRTRLLVMVSLVTGGQKLEEDERVVGSSFSFHENANFLGEKIPPA